jgi:folylpolyglutamate synthase/dihydropteroate synthase
MTRFQIKDRKCAHPKGLAQSAKRHLRKHAQMQVLLDPAQALAQALSKAREDDLILVAGSFFLAGELRKKWFPENQILRRRKSF